MATRKTTTAKKSTTAKKTTKTAAKATTSKAKTTAAKPKAAAIKATPAPAPAPTPTVVASATPVVAGPTVRKKELIDRVVLESGMKKKDVKPVVEAMLAVLGRSLSQGEEMIAHPLGKLKVNREKNLPNGKMMIVKVRQNAETVATNDPLAEAAE
ncbi:HU family DNA-binding protein [Octadecabacter sp. R77987]|uniref:HU family DNA-binding protein n=1 Tax=Octadecabacter sp. R77987 TaxID=3093874 RepID=UPI003671141A